MRKPIAIMPTGNSRVNATCRRQGFCKKQRERERWRARMNRQRAREEYRQWEPVRDRERRQNSNEESREKERERARIKQAKLCSNIWKVPVVITRWLNFRDVRFWQMRIHVQLSNVACQAVKTITPAKGWEKCQGDNFKKF